MVSFDYRSLLVKYMGHVADQEGTTFTGRSLHYTKMFTDEEKEELRKLAEESFDDH